MIYRLPTRTKRRYRGKYPKRVNSFSGCRGTYHVELNNGERYVLHNVIWTPRGLRRQSFVGVELADYLCLADRDEYLNPRDMPLSAYAGVIFVHRLTRALHGSMVQQRNMSHFIQTGE